MAATDFELLSQYVEGSQAAFCELVRRHLNMVFSAARRQTRSPIFAEEVTQSVFIKLARDAGRIGPSTPLAAWLHAVTRHTAINVARTEFRRQRREQASLEIFSMNSPTPGWSHVEPVLDEAVSALRAADRSAIILRFFEEKTLGEIGTAMGLTEDAARKRVSRALEQLRAMLLRRGITVSSSVLISDLTTYAIQIAPVKLSATLAALPGIALPPAVVGTAATFAMTTIQKTLCVALLVTASGVGLYQARTISRQDAEIARLRKDNTALTQTQASERWLQETGRVRRDSDSNVPPDSAASEGRAAADRKVIAAMSDWVDRAILLRDRLKASSMWVVPEFRAVKDIDWLDAAKDEALETEADLQKAFARVRSAANHRVASFVRSGLKAYAVANDGLMPTSIEELAPYVEVSVAPGMQLDSATGSSLDRETKHSILGRVLDSDWFDEILAPGTMPLSARKPGIPTVDTDATVVTRWTVRDSLAGFNHALTQFRHVHGGEKPATEAQLQAYMITPMSPSMLKMLFETSQRSVALR